MQSAFLRDMPLGAVAKAVGLRTKRLENVSVSAMEWFVEITPNVLSVLKVQVVFVLRVWWVTPSLGVPVPLSYAQPETPAHLGKKKVNDEI